MDIHVGGMAITEQSLNGDRIVKGMNKGVFNQNVLTVTDIDAVGIVAPLTEDLDVIHKDVEAMEQIDAPYTSECLSKYMSNRFLRRLQLHGYALPFRQGL